MEIRRQPSGITILHKKREIDLSKSEIWFHTNEYFQMDHIMRIGNQSNFPTHSSLTISIFISPRFLFYLNSYCPFTWYYDSPPFLSYFDSNCHVHVPNEQPMTLGL